MPPTHRVPHPALGSVRCRIVVGATGFGKSHLAHQQEPDARVLRAIDLVDARGTVDLGPLDAPTAIVESLHRLSPDGQASLVRALADHPGTARVTLTGRIPLAAGLHDMDLAVETCGPDELRLSAADLRHLVRTALDPADEGTTHRIAEVLGRLTDGWPALVRLALDEGPGPWERGADPTEWLSRPRGRVTRWVETQLLASLPAGARRLLTLGRDLRPFPRALAARGVDGEPSDATAWDLLCDTGVITAASDEPRVVRLVAACLARAARAPEGASSWWAAASDWYLAHGHPEAALRSARYADDAARCQAILDEYGDDVIAAGGAQEVLTTVAALPRGPRVPAHPHPARPRRPPGR